MKKLLKLSGALSSLFGMGKDGKGGKQWCAIEAKSFELSAEGFGRKLKTTTTERCRGMVS